VLGPLLYVVYTAELDYVVARHQICLHQYADDGQIYVSCMASRSSLSYVVDRFADCLYDVDSWLKASRLQLLNASTRSSQQLQRLNIPHVNILSTRVDVIDTARDLGVIIDSQVSLSAQVVALSRSGYFQLRQLRPIIRSSLTMEADDSASICRLDYFNSLLYGISGSPLQRLQLVKNAAARLVGS